MPELTEQGLFPAEHRALRELHATASQVRTHWAKLERRLDEPVLGDGAAAADELLRQLEARVDLSGRPAAQGGGAGLAGVRRLADVLLERNQALRSALLDIQHVVTLLGYLAGLARTRGDVELEAWHLGWEHRLRALEDRGRAAAAALAQDPDRAIEPAEDGALGRAGAKLGVALGTVGEALDQSPLGRLARRRAT
ncbi:hypothetical protein DVA67_026585 [Solirubrobacter sp. CPCC 204708]|uniref:Uncharacterized protein n=1 Tax=Solirubrobacter deserti TaxID=2282478 RepID=A0ABT4RF36_9ACTN|nr:hypothetical protein [Solirubrobacter deserti]MBE2319563.1 hypothetical protein [Solirubrobacter deserti]MDA0137150.1 hypothetical protein [Solirubrobacter deserti]